METLDMCEGAPSPSANAYRHAMYELFFKTYGKMARTICALLPNGDWRVRTRVQFYPPGRVKRDNVDKSAIATVFANCMLKAFLPKTLRIFAVHHWTGFDACVDQQGGMESCHYLASRTVKRFIAKFPKPKKTQTVRKHDLALLDDDAPAPAPLHDAEPVGVAGAAQEGNVGGGVDPAMKSNILKGPDQWAEENKNVRAVTETFWEQKPLWHLVLARKTFTPIQRLQQTKFSQAGAVWEFRQRAGLARKKNRGEDLTNGRTYRMLERARNTAENKCKSEIAALFEPVTPWEHLMDPEAKGLTVHARQLAFRMASRAGCALEQNMIMPQGGWPGRAVRIPWEPQFAAELDEKCRKNNCTGGLVDNWSRSLWEQFPSPSLLQSQKCKAVILLMLMLACVDGSALESLHATIRRLILSAAVHTHVRSFKDVNASWLMVTARRHLKRMEKVSKQAEPSKPKTRASRRTKRKQMSTPGPEPANKRVRRPGAGGSWRAFVRQRLWGCKHRKPLQCYGAQLSEEYSYLSESEHARLREIGRCATEAKKKTKTTKSSFGLTGQDIERRQTADWHRGLRNMLSYADSQMDEMAALTDLTAVGTGLAGALAVQQIDHRIRGSVEVKNLQKDAEELVQFGANASENTVEQFRSKVLDGHIIPIPSELGSAHEIFQCTDEHDTDIANLIGYNGLHFAGPRSMQSGLDDAWDALNSTFLDADCCPACPKPEKLPKECRDAGMCLCTPAGKELKQLKTSINDELIKPRAVPNSAARVALKEGRWSLLFEGAPLDLDAVDIMDLAEDAELGEVILHIGYQTLKPWRSSFQVLRRAAAPVGEPKSSDDLLYFMA